MTAFRWTNDPQATLAGGISSTSTSLSVQTGQGSQFPTGDFMVKIDGEFLLVGSRSGDVFSGLTRGRETALGGSAPVSHAADAGVFQPITAGQAAAWHQTGVDELTDADIAADAAIAQSKIALDFPALNPIVSSLPALPNAGYPAGIVVTRSSDDTLWQNIAGTWTGLAGSGGSSGIAGATGTAPLVLSYDAGTEELTGSVDAATTSGRGAVQLATPSSDTTAGHVVQASDARLSDSRTPAGAAGGDLTGTYPDPTIGSVGAAALPAATTSAQGAVVLATPSSDVTAGHVIQGTDARLSDTRTPTDGSVTTAKLASGAVTDAKVTDVAYSKLTGVPSTFAPADATPTTVGGVEIDQAPPSGHPRALTVPRLGAASGVAPLDSSGMVPSMLVPADAPTGVVAEAGRWTRSASNPILSPDQSYENTAVQEPSVIYDAGAYTLWYTAGWSTPSIARATSTDGVTWTKHGQVIGLGHGGWAGDAVHGRVRKINGIYSCYFCDGVRPNSAGNLRYATSPDGVTWTDQGQILAYNAIGGADGWANPNVWLEGDASWHMLVETDNGTYWETHLFSSSDGVAWTHTAGPLTTLQQHAGGMYGGTYVVPTSPKRNGLYHCWFHAASASGNLPTDVYHATSPDLVTWTRVGSGAVLSHLGTGFEIDQVSDPCVIEVNGTVSLYYDGANNAASTLKFGLATVTGSLAEVIDGVATTSASGGAGSTEVGYVSASGAVTTASTSFVDVTGMSLTVTMPANACMLEFYCALADFTAGAATPLRFDVQLWDATASASVEIAYVTAQNNLGGHCIVKARVNPGAGSRTYKARFQAEAGTQTARLYADANSLMYLRVTS